LFNSSLHFIGFGRGAVVNSEIIQRLGTFFPETQERYANFFPDVHMTTIDPNNNSASTNGGENYFDPTVEVWDNVDFADNYYQTVSPNNLIGRELGGADYNVLLNGRAGFVSNADGSNNAHERALAWYTGTMDIGVTKTKDGYGIQRRWGDFSLPELNVKNNSGAESWYQPVFSTLGERLEPNEKKVPVQEEGIGTGWFYSVLGGGYDRRSEVTSKARDARRWVGYDNTATREQRGDYAVPTLFNGDFDAISSVNASQLIPGWSFYNGTAQDLNQSSLLNITQIDSLSTVYQIGWNKRPTATNPGIPIFGTYLSQLGLVPTDPGNKDFALKLDSGKTITHNRFVVPDWGVLRFDLHAPSFGGQVEVTITEEGNSSNSVTQIIRLEEANGPYSDGYNDDDTYRIGYGSVGFETFHINVPEPLRNKIATVTFAAKGNTVYLDDVFFKSENLLLGNPTNARSTLPADTTNFLLERPQYAMSYNTDTRTPNWVSWQLHNRWTGAALRPGEDGNPYPPGTNSRVYPWQVDRELQAVSISSPFPEAYLRPDDKYINPDATNPNGYLVQPQRGHITAVADRDRHMKDLMATFFTSNIFAQHRDLNTGQWSQMEGYLQNKLVDQERKELYIISGGYGFNTKHTQEGGRDRGIDIPDHVWKVVAVLESGQGIADITAATPLIVVDMPNDIRAVGSQWHDISNGYRIRLGDLENRINSNGGNINFFSHLPKEIQQALKNKPVDNLPAPVSSAFLLADLGENSLSSIEQPFSQTYDLSVGKFSALEGTVAETSLFDNSTTQINSFEESLGNIVRVQRDWNIFFKDNIPQISVPKVGLNEDTALENTIAQVSSAEIAAVESTSIKSGISQDSSTHIGVVVKDLPMIGITPIGVTQVGIAEINLNQATVTQVGMAKIGFSEINSLQLKPTQINTSQIHLVEHLSPLSLAQINEFFTGHNFNL
jgi:DNA/RNA endonuclease G (NUC1)